jgi:glycosyltransferase involved in cell wall biosynthesis
MTAEPPLISFITPTFNSVATVGATIASVEREAAGFEYEHLFVDGGSTDGTIEVIKELKNGRALIVSEPDKGTYDAMNKGIQRANGEWVAIINSDDQYLPGSVAAIVKAAEANSFANILHGDVVVRLDDRDSVVKPGLGWRGRLGMIHPIWHPAMWARRKIYEQYGLYNVRYKIASDQDMFFRLLDSAVSCVYVARPITLMGAGGLSDQYYDCGTLELLEIHSLRSSLYGLAAHLLFYRQGRLRRHPTIAVNRFYWLWAANDFLIRRLGRCSRPAR